MINSSIYPHHVYCDSSEFWYRTPPQSVSPHVSMRIECPGCHSVYFRNSFVGEYHSLVGVHHKIVYATEYTRWSISSSQGHEMHTDWSINNNWNIPITLGKGELVRPLFMMPLHNKVDGSGPEGIQESFIPVPLTKELRLTPDDVTICSIRSFWGNLHESGHGSLPIVSAEQAPEIRRQHDPYNLEIWWKRPIYLVKHNLIYCGMTLRDDPRS